MIEDRPRGGKFADKPGAYKLVVRSNRQLLDPGEDLRAEVLVTGYGNIQTAKMVVYPDTESINSSESKYRFNMRQIEDRFYFGATQKGLSEDGVVIDFGSGGMKYPKWKSATNFFDASEGATPKISTETIQYAPNEGPDTMVTFNLKLHKKARPGQHSLNLILTYYNGESWCSSETIFQFSVRNFYQRHEIAIWLLGLVATALSLLSSLDWG